MSKFVTRFMKNESGATAIEYGLIVALIAVVPAAAVNPDDERQRPARARRQVEVEQERLATGARILDIAHGPHASPKSLPARQRWNAGREGNRRQQADEG